MDPAGTRPTGKRRAGRKKKGRKKAEPDELKLGVFLISEAGEEEDQEEEDQEEEGEGRSRPRQDVSWTLDDVPRTPDGPGAPSGLETPEYDGGGGAGGVMILSPAVAHADLYFRGGGGGPDTGDGGSSAGSAGAVRPVTEVPKPAPAVAAAAATAAAGVLEGAGEVAMWPADGSMSDISDSDHSRASGRAARAAASGAPPAVGDRVSWLSHDLDLPPGSVGTVRSEPPPNRCLAACVALFTFDSKSNLSSLSLVARSLRLHLLPPPAIFCFFYVWGGGGGTGPSVAPPP